MDSEMTMPHMSAGQRIFTYSRPDGLLSRMRAAAREAPKLTGLIPETTAEYAAALRARDAREAAHIAHTNARTAKAR